MKIEKIILSPGEKKPGMCCECGLKCQADEEDTIYCFPLNLILLRYKRPVKDCPITEQHVSTNPIPPNCIDPESLDNTVSEA